jgi:cell division protein FtsW (lipid II flippase)
VGRRGTLGEPRFRGRLGRRGALGNLSFVAAAGAALLALRLLQTGRRGWAALAILLTLALSPLAFVLLAIVLAGQYVARRPSRTTFALPAAAILGGVAIELALWRIFPDAGRYPFPTASFLAVCAFCLVGLWLTWRVRSASVLRGVFAVYLLVCLATYAVPSSIGENVTRLRYAAVPLILLALGLRRWRPLPVSLVAIVLATSWNVTPLAFSFAHGANDASASRAYWRPAIGFLHRRLTPEWRRSIPPLTGRRRFSRSLASP